MLRSQPVYATSIDGSHQVVINLVLSVFLLNALTKPQPDTTIVLLEIKIGFTWHSLNSVYLVKIYISNEYMDK